MCRMESFWLSFALRKARLGLGDQRRDAGRGLARHGTRPCAAEKIETLGFGEFRHSRGLHVKGKYANFRHCVKKSDKDSFSAVGPWEPLSSLGALLRPARDPPRLPTAAREAVSGYILGWMLSVVFRIATYDLRRHLANN